MKCIIYVMVYDFILRTYKKDLSRECNGLKEKSIYGVSTNTKNQYNDRNVIALYIPYDHFLKYTMCFRI